MMHRRIHCELTCAIQARGDQRDANRSQRGSTPSASRDSLDGAQKGVEKRGKTAPDILHEERKHVHRYERQKNVHAAAKL